MGMKVSCHTLMRHVTSLVSRHISMCHVIYQWVMSQLQTSCHIWIWMCHVTNQCVMSPYCAISRINASYHQCRCSHCNTLQHTATHCNTLPHTATHIWTWMCHVTYQCIIFPMQVFKLQHTATDCNTLQHTATHCNTLQHTATHCITLQHTATHVLPMQIYADMLICAGAYKKEKNANM